MLSDKQNNICKAYIVHNTYALYTQNNRKLIIIIDLEVKTTHVFVHTFFVQKNLHKKYYSYSSFFLLKVQKGES